MSESVKNGVCGGIFVHKLIILMLTCTLIYLYLFTYLFQLISSVIPTLHFCEANGVSFVSRVGYSGSDHHPDHQFGHCLSTGNQEH